jgi:hypothetical protein
MEWLTRARLVRSAIVAIAGCVLLSGAVVGQAYWRVQNRTRLEFRITQNTDLIRFSGFGEPPQFAIWPENPAAGNVRTVYVTRRSATGEWEGKVECPAALPGWFAAYRKESGRERLPTPDVPAPDAVSGATPKGEDFSRAVEVEPGSAWICWIEVNISADFSEAFPEFNETTGFVDTDKSGQPSLVYRCEVTATPGEIARPELYGYVEPGSLNAEIVRDLRPITTARDIFTSIEISVVRPPVKLL